jgi:hypothetical protein
MNNLNPIIKKRWIRVAAFSGLFACIVYPIATNVPLPGILQLILGASFGPALAFASIGLYKILKLNKDSISIQAAVVSNILAGAMVTAMFVIQLSVRYSAEINFSSQTSDESVKLIANRIWDIILGLDVTFDVFIGLGTILFGVAMLKHPRFGKLIGTAGIITGAVFILGFNFYTFPEPPGEAGLIDTGPITGIWYLWVVIYVFRSFKWFDEQIDFNNKN